MTTIKKPSLKVAPGSEFVQEADGVAITLTPTDFSTRQIVNRTLEEKQSVFTVNDQYTYKVTDTPVIFYEPLTIGFTLEVVNNLDHVLRFKDCVMTLSVDGKPHRLREATELLETVLVPQQSWEGQLTGPEWPTMPKSCNLVFSIYDVVTDVDAANNPTKRTNFEWVFSYELKRLNQQVQIKRYEKKMTREQAAVFAKGIG